MALAGVVIGFCLNGLAVRKAFRRPGSQVSPFLYHLTMGICFSVMLLLVMGVGSHNLYRYNWLWFGALQAVAVHFALQQARLRWPAAAKGVPRRWPKVHPGRVPVPRGAVTAAAP
jgi:hypothetical protein